MVGMPIIPSPRACRVRKEKHLDDGREGQTLFFDLGEVSNFEQSHHIWEQYSGICLNAAVP